VFAGTVPPEMRSLVLECSRAWPKDQGAWIGCSGNMTLERTLGPAGFAVHGNDISIYTCALGFWFAGRKVPVEPNEEKIREHGIDWVLPYLDGGSGTLAVMFLGTRFLAFAGKDQAYHRRMVDGYRRQFPKLVAGTKEKIEAHPLRLASFTADDVLAYMADLVPASAPFASFPSFYAGGYTTMWKPLAEHFTWDAPDVKEIDEAGKQRMLDLAVNRPHWVIGVREEIPELAEYRRGVVQVTHRAMPFNVYASGDTTRVVTPHQVMEPILVTKLAPDAELTGRLALHRLSAGQFNGLRAQWMNKKIPPAAPPYPVAVTCGGVLIGAFAYDRSSYTPDGVYLLSDFPAPSTRYRRLAKLIVMAAMSREAAQLMQSSFSRRLRTITSTAFSVNPVSSKYGRGIPGMVRSSRKKAEPGAAHRWVLNYTGPLGGLTLAETLALWTRKHSEDRRGQGEN
jgi:hypothetical protein